MILPNVTLSCWLPLSSRCSWSGKPLKAEQRAHRRGHREQQVAELTRVLDETAASYQELQQEHAATLEELAWYKRWTYGRKRERFTEGTQDKVIYSSWIQRLPRIYPTPPLGLWTRVSKSKVIAAGRIAKSSGTSCLKFATTTI